MSDHWITLKLLINKQGLYYIRRKQNGSMYTCQINTYYSVKSDVYTSNTFQMFGNLKHEHLVLGTNATSCFSV